MICGACGFDRGEPKSNADQMFSDPCPCCGFDPLTPALNFARRLERVEAMARAIETGDSSESATGKMGPDHAVAFAASLVAALDAWAQQQGGAR